MKTPSSNDPKELFYTTLKEEFVKALADNGLQISEDVAPDFIRIMTKSLHNALDTTFLKVGPQLKSLETK